MRRTYTGCRWICRRHSYVVVVYMSAKVPGLLSRRPLMIRFLDCPLPRPQIENPSRAMITYYLAGMALIWPAAQTGDFKYLKCTLQGSYEKERDSRNKYHVLRAAASSDVVR